MIASLAKVNVVKQYRRLRNVFCWIAKRNVKQTLNVLDTIFQKIATMIVADCMLQIIHEKILEVITGSIAQKVSKWFNNGSALETGIFE